MDITERKQAEEDLRTSREQLRRLAARLQSVREAERTLIAREIHDQLGQMLTALKIDLSQVAKKLAGDGHLLEQIRSTSELVDTTIRSVQRISTELRPGILDDLGLPAAIEWQAQEFQSRTGIRCRTTRLSNEITLGRTLSTAVFRIFQEVLTNVARHAGARTVKVRLQQKAGILTLKVNDDGRGITEKQITDTKSLGILGMRERALMFGGELDIQGIPGKGTTVSLQIPIAECEQSVPAAKRPDLQTKRKRNGAC